MLFLLNLFQIFKQSETLQWAHAPGFVPGNAAVHVVADSKDLLLNVVSFCVELLHLALDLLNSGIAQEPYEKFVSLNSMGIDQLCPQLRHTQSS